MKNLTINTLIIKNFKGIKDFTLEPAGNNISVFGENATGKTTVSDSFSWLLFGKDSAGKSDFQIKPVSVSGDEIHNLETTVEADLDINGKSIRLKKIYSEKYTKKRGTALQEFTGHTTDHFIDDVPVSKKDFDTRIADVINLNAFKLVTSPYEFAGLHWTERRKVLLEICGNIDDQTVIKSDPALSHLSAILNDCSIDDHRAKIKATQKKINEELKQIPARISENQEAVKNAAQPDQKEKARVDASLADLKERLRSLQSNEAVSQKQIRINEIKTAILEEKNNYSQSLNDSRKPIHDEINRLRVSLSSKDYDKKIMEDGIARDQKRVAVLAQAIEAARAKWHEENNKQPTEKDSCPTCGQNLPEDQIQGAIEKFNIQKSDRLSAISKEGKDSRQMHDKLLIDIQEAQVKIEAIGKEITEIHEFIRDRKIKIVSIDATQPDLSDKLRDIGALELEIAALQNGSRVQEKDILDKISDLQSKISAWQVSSAEWDAAQRATDRIAELSEQEKNLAKEYERLESELYLIEQFIVKKVGMLEGQINSKFKMARFKLFNQNINGGIEECCEILFNGVPFDRALNTGARLNVGIDIINTLIEYFEFQAPIFCDNRESVTSLIPSNAQMINLFVSPGVKQLTASSTEVLKAS